MTKLDYQRHERQRRPMPIPGRKYPVWLGYVTILASVCQALGYLGMVLLYSYREMRHRHRRKQAHFS